MGVRSFDLNLWMQRWVVGLEPVEDAVFEFDVSYCGGATVVCAGDDPEGAVGGACGFESLGVMHRDVIVGGSCYEEAGDV